MFASIRHLNSSMTYVDIVEFQMGTYINFCLEFRSHNTTNFDDFIFFICLLLLLLFFDRVMMKKYTKL